MVHQLDITEEHCPMTYVRVKVALSKMPSGDVLEVLLTGEEALTNVPRSAREQGYIVDDATQEGMFYRLRISKP